MSWSVGRATITPVAESSAQTSPRFLFTDLDKAGVLEIAHRHPWLAGTFVDDEGYLLQTIQCLVVDVDGHLLPAGSAYTIVFLAAAAAALVALVIAALTPAPATRTDTDDTDVQPLAA